jgi:Fe-S-cluster containining protein
MADNSTMSIIMASTSKEKRDPGEIALQLKKATALSDGQVFTEMDALHYTTVDYYRMACHLLFVCKRCGKCCTTGDPIRLKTEDAAAIARHLKIPLNKAIKKYTIPDPDKPGVLNFKHILPCKFYNSREGGCKIYAVRPWSCRIFPFLGIYGSEDRVVVNESCPGSVETMKILTAALEDVSSDQGDFMALDQKEVRRAKEFLRQALAFVWPY